MTQGIRWEVWLGRFCPLKRCNNVSFGRESLLFGWRKFVVCVGGYGHG